MSKGKVIWRSFLFLCGAAVIVLGAMRIMKPEEEVVTKPLSTVSAKRIGKGDINIETSLVATVESGDVYYIYPKVSGEVKEIYVKKGDKVKAGDKLFLIDNEKAIDAAKIQMDSASITVDNVTESLELAKTNYSRMSALHASGDISDQAFEQAKNSLTSAENGLTSANLALDGAKLSYDTQVEFATVTAPADGTVETLSVVLNGMVSQAASACSIASDNDSKITFGVTDRLQKTLKEGDEIRIEKQGETAEGKITSVSDIKDNSTGMYTAEAKININDGIKGVISSGSSVKVYFISESSKDTYIADTDSVYYDGGKSYVYTLTYDDTVNSDESVSISENNRAATVHKIEVETGLVDGEKTEIISGISEDDLIISTWTGQLYEGAAVQAIPEE